MGHDDQLQWPADHLSLPIFEAPKRLNEPARQLDDYVAKKRHSFAVSLDLQLGPGFHRDVLAQLQSIPDGRTATDGAVAKGLGNPRAVPAVGTVFAMNTLPPIIGCYRVERSDDTVGSSASGGAAKRYLLRLEAA